MKQIKAVVVGFGDRGSVYSSYSLEHPEELQIIGVVDPNPSRLMMAKEIYHLNDNQLFTDLDECLKANLPCDIYINGTMDQLHYEVLTKLIKTKKAVLTEKPIVAKKEELLELERLAKENNNQIFVGHVLRYTPFYKRIKQLILDGEIGEIRSMELAEHVGFAHYAGSFIRGRWNNEEECGSTFLLAKSCHDIDIMCWLNNNAKPHYVSSFGGRYYFKEENAPVGSTDKCHMCPYEQTCYYSALNCYVKANFSSEQTRLDRVNKTEDEIKEQLKDTIFDQCVYKVQKSNLVDRQVVTVEFDNGSVCSFTLVGGTPEPCRTITVIGTKGEISGKLEEGIIYLKKEKLHTTEPSVRTIDVNAELHNDSRMPGHSGGDYEIMKSIVQYMNGDTKMITITKLFDSINGHICVYAADEARLTHRVIELKR